MMYAYAILRSSGKIDIVDSDTPFFTLSTLNSAVGGWIEIVRSMDNQCLLCVNEEGILRGLPLNVLATALYSGMNMLHPIVGDAVIGIDTCDMCDEPDIYIPPRSWLSEYLRKRFSFNIDSASRLGPPSARIKE